MPADYDRLGTGEWARTVPSDDAPDWVPRDALVQVERRKSLDTCTVVVFSDRGSAEIRVDDLSQGALRRVTPPPWADR